MPFEASITNVFVLLDIGFDPAVASEPENGSPASVLRLDRSNHRPESGTRLQRLLDEGSSWIFYGGGYRDERARVQIASSASGRVTDPREKAERDARVVFLSESNNPVTGRPAVGVLTIWMYADVRFADPLSLKQRAEQDQDRLKTMVKSLGLNWDDVGRIFVFVSSQIESEDLDDFVGTKAKDVATLFTGGLEDETDARLGEYVKTNISTRRYERLYLRWTDGVALYDKSERGRHDRELATMRALRIVETGLLMRRLLRDVSYDLTVLSGSISALTVPFIGKSWRQNERIKRTTSEARLTTLVAPPVHSIEGENLLERAFTSFSIPELFANVEKLQAELQRRLDWSRSFWLAVWAGVTFAVPVVVAILVKGG